MSDEHPKVCEKCGEPTNGAYYVQDGAVKCLACYEHREPSGSMADDCLWRLEETVYHCENFEVDFDEKIVPWLGKLDHVTLFVLAGIFAAQDAPERAKEVACYAGRVWGDAVRPDPAAYIGWRREMKEEWKALFAALADDFEGPL